MKNIILAISLFALSFIILYLFIKINFIIIIFISFNISLFIYNWLTIPKEFFSKKSNNQNENNKLGFYLAFIILVIGIHTLLISPLFISINVIDSFGIKLLIFSMGFNVFSLGIKYIYLFKKYNN